MNVFFACGGTAVMFLMITDKCQNDEDGCNCLPCAATSDGCKAFIA